MKQKIIERICQHQHSSESTEEFADGLLSLVAEALPEERPIPEPQYLLTNDAMSLSLMAIKNTEWNMCLAEMKKRIGGASCQK